MDDEIKLAECKRLFLYIGVVEMELKKYQERTLKILEKFLSEVRAKGVETAYKENRDAEGYAEEYQPFRKMYDVPYICLRLPTGGGKTLIGTKAIISAAENFLQRENLFVLWLVPTKEIRQQTLRVLRDPKNFYGKILRAAFNENVNIFDVTDFRRLRPNDLKSGLNICVATFQSFRVEDKEGRKVYQPDEELESCFANIPRQNYFEVDEKGRYNSFGNLIAYLRPLMIVDEAHNYSTPLSFGVTEKLRPSAIIELTATPADNSNLLVRISADELQAEGMVKLPIILGTVENSPEKAMDLAIQKRAALKVIAGAESEYIRPIALYQAESKNLEFNVDYVRRYLIEEAHIPENQVAVATGERHELDSVNLFSRECTIRHIITVQALKEGWDCPFAYVFCSLAKTHSTKDAEQLLGRVMRMPYATRRKFDELNESYVFFRVNDWTEAVGKIKDNLFDMGFDKREVARALGIKQTSLNFKMTVEFETVEPPKINALTTPLQNCFEVKKVGESYRVTLKDVTEENLQEIEDKKNKIFRKDEDRQNFMTERLKIYFNPPQTNSPSERGEKFAVPQLCLNLDGKIFRIKDREDIALPDDWTLAETGDYKLPLYHSEAGIRFIIINSKGDKVTEHMVNDVEEEKLLFGKTNWTQNELINWLGDRIYFKEVPRTDFAEYTRRALNCLVNEKNFSLEELVRMRYSLRKILAERIERIIDTAYEQSWQVVLFKYPQKVCTSSDINFVFKNDIYPVKKPYSGTVVFSKHYYPSIGDMNREEVECAQYIDANKNVKFWVRNIERDPQYSFWLQLHKNKFYPDFVIMLKDGTIAVVEYKGAMLADNEDTREKNMLGEIWAKESGGKCKFLMATHKDSFGRRLSTQLAAFL